jgi:hypothetical protein
VISSSLTLCCGRPTRLPCAFALATPSHTLSAILALAQRAEPLACAYLDRLRPWRPLGAELSSSCGRISGLLVELNPLRAIMESAHEGPIAEQGPRRPTVLSAWLRVGPTVTP